MAIKQYLSYEGQRNRKNAALYERMIKLAYGANNAVIVGHHLTFEADGNLETENEIPAADTLLFDHEVMTALFGDGAIEVMKELASVNVEYRDELALEFLNMYGPEAVAEAPPALTALAPYSEGRDIPADRYGWARGESAIAREPFVGNSIPHIPAELG
jgi:hypothetical protein